MRIAINQYPLAPIAFLADKVSNAEKKYLSEDSGIIIDASDLYFGQGTEVFMLNQALKSIRKKTAFEQIVTEYPSLYDSTIIMVRYFTRLTPAEGGMSLLSKCLLNGINAFNKAHQKFYMSSDPSIKMSAFINGVSATFHEIMFNNIYGKYEDSWVQWKPLTEPIYNWILRYQFKQVLIVPTSAKVSAASYNAAANKLLYEVFNFSDLSFCGISAVPDKVLVAA